MQNFDDLFVRQRDEYSCGVACLTTIAKLYSAKGIDYDSLRQKLSPCPDMGSCHLKMERISRDILPFAGAGEGCYSGGIAIAYIFDGDEDHYVVLLAKKGENVIYYDPYDHQLVIKKLAEINGMGTLRPLENWVINFQPLDGYAFEDWEKLRKTSLPDLSKNQPPPNLVT